MDESTAGDTTEAAGRPRRPVLAVVVTVVGVALVVLTAATIYGLARDAGSGSARVADVLVWSILPAVVLAIGLRLSAESFARRTVHWALLIVPSYGVAVLALGAGAMLGAAA